MLISHDSLPGMESFDFCFAKIRTRTILLSLESLVKKTKENQKKKKKKTTRPLLAGRLQSYSRRSRVTGPGSMDGKR